MMSEKDTVAFFEDQEPLEEIMSLEEDTQTENIIDTEPQEEELQEELEEEPEVEFFEAEAEMESPSNAILALDYLKRLGIVNYEPEGELTEETAEEIIKNSIDEEASKRLEALINSMPKEIAELNKHILNGGDPLDYDGFSSKETDHETIVREQLEKEGLDQEDIDDQVEYLKNNGRLEKRANFYSSKLQKELENQQKAENENRQKQDEDARLSLKSRIGSFLESKNDVKGLKLSNDEKTSLPDYMTERKFKTDSGLSITGMQKDLQQALQNEEKAVLLAKMLRNDFDFKELKTKIETDTSKKLKDNIQRSKQTTPNKSLSESSFNSKKFLADFF